jgi:hypothetical protein
MGFLFVATENILYRFYAACSQNVCTGCSRRKVAIDIMHNERSGCIDTIIPGHGKQFSGILQGIVLCVHDPGCNTASCCRVGREAVNVRWGFFLLYH